MSQNRDMGHPRLVVRSELEFVVSRLMLCECGGKFIGVIRATFFHLQVHTSRNAEPLRERLHLQVAGNRESTTCRSPISRKTPKMFCERLVFSTCRWSVGERSRRNSTCRWSAVRANSARGRGRGVTGDFVPPVFVARATVGKRRPQEQLQILRLRGPRVAQPASLRMTT